MEIVINTCYGGFGVSAQALVELVKRESSAQVSMTLSEYTGGHNNSFYHMGTRITIDEYEFDSWMPGVLYKDNIVYMLKDGDGIRKDLGLISVVRELGDAANGRHAKLKVVEIPNGTKYEIEEYDGMEWVAEVHQTWQ